MRSIHYFAVLLIELGDEFLTMGQEGEGVSGGDVSEVSALGGTQGVTADEREREGNASGERSGWAWRFAPLTKGACAMYAAWGQTAWRRVVRCGPR